MKNFYKKGITLLEVLMAVAILGIIVSVALPQFSKIKENQVLQNTTQEILSALRQAQSQSLASVSLGEFGVHFQKDQIVIFKGQSFSAGAMDNNVIDIVSPANISNVTFSGLSSETGDIYFSRLSGVPNKNGTITVSTPSNSKTITLSATGTASVN